MKDLIDFNKKYGKLSILKELEPKILPSGQKNRNLLCKCDCGNETEVRWLHLKRNRILSCGCVLNKRNGLGSSLICKVWRQMISRTSENSKDIYYKRKNIKTCDEWINSFDSFYKWSIENGYEKGLEIDRIDNNGNYSPENCRWVTRIVNVNNRDKTLFIDYKGKKIALCILLRELNKLQNYSTIFRRIKRGWNPEKAVDTKIKEGNYKNKT